jgi:multidrug efflux pump
LTTPVVYLALDRFRRRSPHEQMLARQNESQGIQPA